MTINELKGEINRIKLDSEDLALMTTGAEGALKNNVGMMAQLVRGSRTGEDAVAAVQKSIQSLNKAAASMRTLGCSCDDCLRNLAK